MRGRSPGRPSSSIMTIDFPCLRKRAVPFATHLPRSSHPIDERPKSDHNLLGLPTPNPEEPFFSCWSPRCETLIVAFNLAKAQGQDCCRFVFEIRRLAHSETVRFGLMLQFLGRRKSLFSAPLSASFLAKIVAFCHDFARNWLALHPAKPPQAGQGRPILKHLSGSVVLRPD